MFCLMLGLRLAIVDQVDDRAGLVELDGGELLEVAWWRLPRGVLEGELLWYCPAPRMPAPLKFRRTGWGFPGQNHGP